MSTHLRAVCIFLITAFCAAFLSPPAFAAEREALTLTLDDSVARALARDELVKDAELALENARLSLVRAETDTPRMSVNSSARGSSDPGFDPQSVVSGTKSSSQSYGTSLSLPISGANLSLSSGASSSETNSALRSGGDETFSYASAYASLGLYAPLGIFRNERVLNEGDVWLAEMSVAGAELNLDDLRRRIVRDALRYFYSALRSQRSLEIARDSLDYNEQLLRIAEEKFRLGRVPEIQVMDARINADSARVSVRSQEAFAQNDLDALKDFLGIPLDTSLTLTHTDAPAAQQPELGEAQLVEIALNQRADVRRARISIQSSEVSLERTEAYTRPGVSFNASYSRSGGGDTIAQSFDSLRSPSWGVGLSTSISLNKKSDRASIESARKSLENTRASYELLEDDVRLQIRRLLRTVATSAANVDYLEESVARAEESLNIHRLRFERGLDTPLDVTSYEQQLERTRLNYSNALIDYQLALAELHLAIGETPLSAQIQEQEVVSAGPAASTAQ